MPPLAISALRSDEVDQALPLVQLHLPHASLPRWRAFARSYLRAPRARGIIAARDLRGIILGLAPYRRDLDPEAGPSLVIDRMLYVSLVEPESVAIALIEALQDEARRLGCRNLRVRLGRLGTLAWSIGDDVRLDLFRIRGGLA